MIRTRHPGHPTQARLHWPRDSHNQNTFRALNLGSPARLGHPVQGHAAPRALVESAGAKSPTAAPQTVSTSLSSCACGGGAANWANLRLTWPAALLNLDAGRFHGRHVGPASEAERAGDRCAETSVRFPGQRREMLLPV